MITLIELNLSSNGNDLDNFSWCIENNDDINLSDEKNRWNFVSRFHQKDKKRKFWLTQIDINNNQTIFSQSASKTRTMENDSFPWTTKNSRISTKFVSLNRLDTFKDGKNVFSFLFRWIIGYLHHGQCFQSVNHPIHFKWWIHTLLNIYVKCMSFSNTQLFIFAALHFYSKFQANGKRK